MTEVSKERIAAFRLWEKDELAAKIVALEDEIDAMARLRSPTEAMGEVKALEWVAFDNGTAWAQTFVGLAYQARPDGWLFRNGALNAVDGGIGAAKAAAQADFELRISAHLSHPPAREAVDDAMVERACIRLQGGRE